MTVTVPEIVLNGVGGSPRLHQVDPPVQGGVQSGTEVFRPVCRGVGGGLEAIGERGQNIADRVRPGQVGEDAVMAT